MKGIDWFIAGCRLMGVWAAANMMDYLAAYFDMKLGYTQPLSRESDPGGYLIHAIGHCLIALYLLFGTRHLAGLCYGLDEPAPSEPIPTPSAK